MAFSEASSASQDVPADDDVDPGARDKRMLRQGQVHCCMAEEGPRARTAESPELMFPSVSALMKTSECELGLRSSCCHALQTDEGKGREIDAGSCFCSARRKNASFAVSQSAVQPRGAGRDCDLESEALCCRARQSR